MLFKVFVDKKETKTFESVKNKFFLPFRNVIKIKFIKKYFKIILIEKRIERKGLLENTDKNSFF